MKRIFAFAIAASFAALAIVSCKKDPTPDPDPDPVPVSDVITGTGTIADPYVLYKPEHLVAIADTSAVVSWTDRASYFKADSTCFKLGNDIDLEGADWTPIDLKIAEKDGKKIDFDGAGHTIKNFKVTGEQQVGFFKNYVGNLHNLKIEGAEINCTGKKAGILIGQCGTKSLMYTVVNRCSVKGKVTFTGDGSVDTEVSLGGLIGQNAGVGEVNECSADVDITLGTDKGLHYVGGIIGSLGKPGIAIRNCISKGNLIAVSGSNASQFGGIVATSQNNSNIITNCISLAKIECADIAGGIISLMNYNKVQTAVNTNEHDSHITGCIAWNESINVAEGATYGKGAIIGWGSPRSEYKNCWRNPSLTGFTDDEDHDADEKAANCTTYNGKAATGKTASAVAKEIGWDETIWDLSGDVPALICLK